MTSECISSVEDCLTSGTFKFLSVMYSSYMSLQITRLLELFVTLITLVQHLGDAAVRSTQCLIHLGFSPMMMNDDDEFKITRHTIWLATCVVCLCLSLFCHSPQSHQSSWSSTTVNLLLDSRINTRGDFTEASLSLSWQPAIQSNTKRPGICSVPHV